MRLAAEGGHAAHGSAARVMASPIAWRRSSWCATQSYVEISDLPDGSVAVWDSKSPDSTPILVFAPDEWNAFISGLKSGTSAAPVIVVITGDCGPRALSTSPLSPPSPAPQPRVAIGWGDASSPHISVASGSVISG